ncbi:ATP-binding protein [Endozoicomonas acroporae]|uniref:ATP-binding protein n=1 Tax=Endozoicomonas acroporae TaxID=1701104 RepID=UPI0013D4C08E|nr:DUF499 domain-containing protein [Endozoicomonas acroporae]
MSLKPWREIATPHKDVLGGTFQQSEFAADISQVATGIATDEYQNPVSFFARTFITEGMRMLLLSVARRLAGQGGDPVIQLQTSFGGGKTHTMLAVYHLASRSVPTSSLEGIPPILDEAGIAELPAAKVAVLDGLRLSPSQPQMHGSTAVNTLWGEMAWQLLGAEGYEMIAASDRDGTSPGKDNIARLLSRAAPCVILIDELQKFFSQLAEGRSFNAGTYESNLAFVQALTEALKTVPNAVVLASLPESDAEIGGTMGEQALLALEKHFGRVESVWKPVGTNEAFEIVRRRLFENAGGRAQVEGICRQFHDFYRNNSDRFPLETQSNEYFERLCQSYPIHPEIFDRLYEDWSTLDKFQRTRGVLQYMAVVIHRLWEDNNQDAMIMPGSLSLGDSGVRTKSTHYLPVGWEPVIEKEVDGPKSQARDIDNGDTRFGSVQAAQRVMRTIFLGSAPAASSQNIKGVELDTILLGSVQPGQTIGCFEDVLKRLRDKLQYLYSDQNRFWLDTKPNLRREMESRKQNINDREALIPLLQKRVQSIFGTPQVIDGIHVFASSADVPDGFSNGPRLVVLPPEAKYSRVSPALAQQAAEHILKFRGEQPRQKQNRVIFLAPDGDVVNRLKDAGRTYIAWQSIVSDINSHKLNLDLFQIDQAKKNGEGADATLMQLVRQTYKWLLCPVEEVPGQGIDWEAVAISSASTRIIGDIEKRLEDEEWITQQWSPIHLKNLLSRWYLKDGKQEVSAFKVWQDCSQYLYLPRLCNDKVFIQTISQGLTSGDFFGYALGKEGDKYLGFSLGSSTLIDLNDECLLIDLDAAVAYQESIKPKPGAEDDTSQGDNGQSDNKGGSGGVIDGGGVKPAVTGGDGVIIKKQEEKKRFFGTIDLDPQTAMMEFSDVVNEVLDHFVSKTGVQVSVSIDIRADAPEGFDEELQRTVRENCNSLKFSASGFEDE